MERTSLMSMDKRNHREESVQCPGLTSPPEQERNPSSQHFSAKRTQALAMMIAGEYVTDIASQTGVHRSTIFRWTREPAFQRELTLHRNDLIEQTIDLQMFASKRAIVRLIEMIDDEDPRISLAAIRIVAPLKAAYVEHDHAKRLRFLEDNLD